MERGGKNWWVVGFAAVMVFAVITLMMLRYMPEPRKDTDFVVIGAAATMGALGVFLLAFVATRGSVGSSKKDPAEK